MTNVLVVGCPFVLSLVLWALQDLDKTQEDVLKHQASISELKRSFMEATPEPRPSQWDKRLTGSPATTLRLQAQGVRVLLLGIRTPPQMLCMPSLSFTSCSSHSPPLGSWFTVCVFFCTVGQLGKYCMKKFVFISLS